MLVLRSQALGTGAVTKQMFDDAQAQTVSLMERESLQGFLSSDHYAKLRERIAAGELEALLEEDIDTVREIMSKEVRRGCFAGRLEPSGRSRREHRDVNGGRACKWRLQ